MIVRSGRKLPRRADADRSLTELYQLHYRTLVRLAALLIPDLATAEDIVQDAFAAVYSAWLGGPAGRTRAPRFPCCCDW